MVKLKENPRYAMSLTFGPREKEIFEEIDEFAKKGLLTDNKNEILRRGLYATRYLAEVDENRLLKLLSDFLHVGMKDPNPEILATARSLSFAVLAIDIAKNGILRAEPFETVPTNLRAIERALPKADRKSVVKSLEELAISVDTIFLKGKQYPLTT